MASGIGKCSKIRHIVRLRQMLRRWRRHAAAPSGSMGKVPPSDVPAGHVAVCVGSSHRRFVVRAAHLNHPVFRRLLAQAEENAAIPGPLTIPCDEFLFEEVLRHIASLSSRFASLEDLQKCCCCHSGLRSAWQAESLPLLRGFVEKQVCTARPELSPTSISSRNPNPRLNPGCGFFTSFPSSLVLLIFSGEDEEAEVS
ncbi:hypothetical protein J5N97_029294 [Dioscorea zingiberensis]|uniref:SAUR family protein n=1 Tax=Dioscorea zingiberensis TaxID=325984 RepID=A0A9D5H5S6_9LILI|nr:hypothetical protein J5N97_029294 [Dioscorea zingiberensis]